MLARENYTKENICRLSALSGNDPSLLEKTIYAFGLLEAISMTQMPFIFKGGTCLLLLLDQPRRLSTDIDIIVEPGTDIDKYIEKAGKLFPFIRQREDVRRGHNNIEKRHYEFTYNSPVGDRPLVILLDVLFEKNQYPSLLEKQIASGLLLTEGENLLVKVPDVNSILGDKLTAFAPHTTGIPFGVGKELEIMKQFFDCCTLFREMTSFHDVWETYKKVVDTELGYRGLHINASDVLKDTISSCICIISKGGINKSEYGYYSDGIRRIGGHIYRQKFNGELAAYMACELLYLATCLYTGTDYRRINDYEDYVQEKLSFKGARSVNYLRKVNQESYAYLVASARLLEGSIGDILLMPKDAGN